MNRPYWTAAFRNWIGSDRGWRCAYLTTPNGLAELSPSLAPADVRAYLGVMPLRCGSDIYVIPPYRVALLREDSSGLFEVSDSDGELTIRFAFTSPPSVQARVRTPEVTAIQYVFGSVPPGAMQYGTPQLARYLGDAGVNLQAGVLRHTGQGSIFVFPNETVVFIQEDPTKAELTAVFPGDWIVYEPDGVPKAYQDEQFRHLFTVIRETPDPSRTARRLVDLNEMET